MKTLWLVRSDVPCDSCIGECQCALTRPGATSRPVASITSTPGTDARFRPISTIEPARTRISTGPLMVWPGLSSTTLQLRMRRSDECMECHWMLTNDDQMHAQCVPPYTLAIVHATTASMVERMQYFDLSERAIQRLFSRPVIE